MAPGLSPERATGSTASISPTPAPGAKKVRFGADFVFCNKSWSVGGRSASSIARVCEEYGNLGRPALDGHCRRPQSLPR